MKFLKSVLKFAIWVGLPLLIAAIVMRVFFLTNVVVGHNGMAPNLIEGEEMLMWNGVDDPELGDVLVCMHPADAQQIVLGRVIAKSGVTIRTHRGNLQIAGQAPSHDILNTVPFRDQGREHQMVRREETLGNSSYIIFTREGVNLRIPETQVPAGSVYLLGDNRPSVTTDSRAFGAVPVSRCLGTVAFYWAPKDIPSAEIDHSFLSWLD